MRRRPIHYTETYKRKIATLLEAAKFSFAALSSDGDHQDIFRQAIERLGKAIAEAEES